MAQPGRVIVTRLIGGLGNQMFQYAAGRALAERLGVALKIDCSGYETYGLHQYGLMHFAIDAGEAGPGERPVPAPHSLLARLRRKLGLGAPSGLRIYRERAFTFDPEVLALGDGVYLDGYWQCERYFAGHEALVRRHLSVRTAPSAENAQWLARIAEAPAVSVHVRRGDYSSNRTTLEFHGLCPPDYYERAARLVAERTAGTPVFFVFSDDPAWARDNLRLGFPTRYVAHNGAARNYEDLRLMSACRHHVIANSTFSWWGAWLNPAPGKLVVAPRRWFRDPAMDDRDLVPADWVRL